MKGKFRINATVLNRFGVLNRVAAVFAKRCCNIYSLSVCETANHEISEMTIVAEGDAYLKDQMIKQLTKLHDVVEAVVVED